MVAILSGLQTTELGIYPALLQTLARTLSLTLFFNRTKMSDDSTALAEPQLLKIDVTVEETSTCQRKVKVSVPREEIDRYYEEAVGDLMPTALLPGFRPGRAPRKLVGSKFKTELNDQIRSKLLNDALARVN